MTTAFALALYAIGGLAALLLCFGVASLLVSLYYKAKHQHFYN